ncbi:protein-disulfide reductase DsbD [Thalassomonas viridans]|uniref:Thiol:disulfide interchange protein DsbD n=1 Tax=Thalassomonas viridans TaxID=137584 RepID=A0AAF0C8B2_9GAMM|nr:protein-disulfide reductase DsbD [Thalassomonas viridans]WDE04558.1 protein-disulfide reductase DsbD [Thalassomonas viridans]
MKQLAISLLLLLTSLSFYSQDTRAQSSIFDTSSASLFSNDDEFLKVEEAFIFDFFQNGDKLQVSFNIAEGYYLYRHQFKFSGNNAEFTAPELPAGIEHEDEFFGITQIFTEPLDLTFDIQQASDSADITIRYQGCAEKGLCYPPTKQVIPLAYVKSKLNGGDKGNGASQAVLAALTPESESQQASGQNQVQAAGNNAANSEQYQLADMLKGDSLWLTLAAFFIGGLLLSFTPCVFPMYPILTGIIVGQGDKLTNKHAFTLSFAYVQGMAVTYTLLGIVVALAGAQFQAMFQHPYVLIGLSALFIFLALSMFGVFNLALPSSWQNKLNNLSNKQKGGSVFGVMAMGAISGLVASPCTTAPLTGALLYISQTGDIALGAGALYALSLGMGLPLLVLGSSGGKLLPKAGNWMTVIKNIFGLLLLAVPVFLLERLIPEMATQLLWATLILASASYFYVVNRDTAPGFWFGVRSLAIFLALFFGANKAYQLIYPQHSTTYLAHVEEEVEFTRVNTLDELNQLVKVANGQGKTVMVDLYADWCIACKEFEKYTFPKPEVQNALANTLKVQIDLTDTGADSSIELMEHFNVFGLPSILFFDLQGNELSQQRITGFMEAVDFADHVNSIFNS